MSNTYLQSAQEYLTNGRLQDCLNELIENVKDKDIKNQVLHLQVRLNSLNRKINSGTINANDAQIEENRISNSILLIISNLAKGPSITNKHSTPSQGYDYKWIVIGLLAMALIGAGIFQFTKKDTTAIDPCANITCQNEGICKNGTCQCPEGFTGDRCQTKVSTNPCEHISCLNGGICQDGKCKCPEGYSGTNCETKLVKENTYSGNSGTFVDLRDKNSYRWERLKDGKIWMAENLNYETSGSFCYNNSVGECEQNGRLYLWDNARTACPEGWRLPSKQEWWNMLRHYGSPTQGKGGESNNLKIHVFGLNFAAGGARYRDKKFYESNKIGYYWSSTPASDPNKVWDVFFNPQEAKMTQYYHQKTNAFSCRCIKK